MRIIWMRSGILTNFGGWSSGNGNFEIGKWILECGQMNLNNFIGFGFGVWGLGECVGERVGEHAGECVGKLAGERV
jgi:hypothetical protein